MKTINICTRLELNCMKFTASDKLKIGKKIDSWKAMTDSHTTFLGYIIIGTCFVFTQNGMRNKLILNSFKY